MTTKNLKKVAMAMALAGSAAVPLAAQAEAQEGPWMVRVRALHLDSANKDSTGLDLSINNRWIPEFDISLLLHAEHRHRTGADLPAEAGHPRRRRPHRLVEAHAADTAAAVPLHRVRQLQALCRRRRQLDTDLRRALLAGRDSPRCTRAWSEAASAPAGQIGFDYKIAQNVYFNFDVKKVEIRTDVKSSGTKVGEFKIDPWLIGVGIGYRF